MSLARALYVCPVTQAAVVAVAPAIAEGVGYKVAKVLLLQGVADATRPTAFESVDAIRSAKGISRFFEQRNIQVRVLSAPPNQPQVWRSEIERALSSDILDGIDTIVFNAQAGTKQMSFGAWDGLMRLVASPDRQALLLRRCFIRSQTSLKVQFEDGEFDTEDVSIQDFIKIYGFEEVERDERTKREGWAWAHKQDIVKLWGHKMRGDTNAAERLAQTLCSKFSGGRIKCPWTQRSLSAGGWLEAGMYVQARERKQSAAVRGFVAGFMKIWDWAGTGTPPTRGQYGLDRHYELDTLIAVNGVLHLIECKSGNTASAVAQEVIHKQGALRERLQGRSGLNVIVTARRPAANSVLGLKAAHQQIQFVKIGDVEISDCLDRMFVA